MSEQVSAFGAYSSRKISNGRTPKKANQRKSVGANNADVQKRAGKPQKTEVRNGVQKQTGKPQKTEAQPKPGAKSPSENKSKVTNGQKAKSNVAPTKLASPQKHEMAKATKQPAKSTTADKTVTNSKANTSEIREDEVDALVEELLGDSPKKLTKAQQRKKQKLEEYLVRQLELDDARNAENSDENLDDSSFTDEYTINSHTDDDDDDDDEEEEEEDSDEEEEECEEEETQVDTGSDDDEVAQTSTKPKIAAVKRKSEPASEASGTKQPKKAEKPCQSAKMPQVKSESQAEHPAVGSTSDMSLPRPPLGPIHKINSITAGERIFTWLIYPIPLKKFFSNNWEKHPQLVKRKKNPDYYQNLISFSSINQMLLDHHVEFTKNIDITSYENGKRVTLNPEGRALPSAVHDFYSQGCSVRLLNPQVFAPKIRTLNATLQEYFHCLVGTNVYLTPPNSQGFAPHYDDIEAFVLQIEGRKRWRLYNPRNSAHVLPRDSSQNFKQSEIGEPFFERVLEPGDMLYFPRGIIHQATTEPNCHSLHLTLSVYQRQSYADLFEQLIPRMLERAIDSNVDLRRGLPLHTWRNAGIAFSNVDTRERSDLLQEITRLLEQSLKTQSIANIVDAAVDQLAKKYQREALPPQLLISERPHTIFGTHADTDANGEVICDYRITGRTNVRLLRANILRLVKEESLRIYFYVDNTEQYCEDQQNYIEIDSELAASVEVLIRSYPAYVGVSQLPLESEERKVDFVSTLFDRGLLMVEKPFK